MKRIILMLLVILSAVVVTGCGDGGKNVQLQSGNGNTDNGNGDGNNVINLQTFVLNNCKSVNDDMPTQINGSSFPDDPVTDPTQSVYTKGCLNN